MVSAVIVTLVNDGDKKKLHDCLLEEEPQSASGGQR